MNLNYHFKYKRLAAIVVMAVLMLPAMLAWAQATSSLSAALVVSSVTVPSERETATMSIFQDYGMTVTYVSSVNLTAGVLESYDLILATEANVMGSALINELIESGKTLALFYNAAEPLGGTWRFSSSSSFHQLVINDNQGPFDGFRSVLPIRLQPTGIAYYISAQYPGGWTAVGSSSSIANKSVLIREHGSGGKGLIFTYNPAQVTQTARNFYDMIYAWLMNETVSPGKTVPAGHVTFIISQYDDNDQSPDLTATETWLQTKLNGYGFNITYIRSSRLKQSNLEGSPLVVAAEYPSIDMHSISGLLAGGRNMALYFTSAASMGGDFRSSTAASYRRLNIEQNQAFFDGYRSDLPFEIQTGGTAYSIAADHPGGWTAIGNSASLNMKTVFVRETGGARGLIYTYSPAETSEAGKNFDSLIFEWLFDEPVQTGKVVPEGHIAFVIKRFNDDHATPDLTPQETWLQSKLLGYGYQISYIRFSRLRHSDLSGARMVVAAEYPSIDLQTVSAALTQGRNVALFYSSASTLGGTWHSSTSASYRILSVDQSQAFLSGYRSDLPFEIQTTGASYVITSGTPGGWTVIGSNNAGQSTVLYREHGSGGKGLIYTYNTANTSGPGRNIDDRIYEWFEGEPAHPGVSVPEGHVAFIISNYNDDASTPDLTPTETALQTKLLGYGYQITYIRSSRQGHSDYSGARLIAGADYPGIDFHTVTDQLAAGKNVAMFYTAAGALGGNWRSSTAGSYRSMVIKPNQAFLNGYQATIDFQVQKMGTAYTIMSDYPGGWTAIAGNGGGASLNTVFTRVHGSGAKGLIYTYNPGEVSETGRNILDLVYQWFEGVPPREGKTVPEGRVAFVINRYDDATEAPDLSPEETALYYKLAGYGYDMTFLGFSRLGNSDLSNADLVVAADYPSIDMHSINNLITSGKKVALFHTAAASLGGNWQSSTSGSYRNLIVEQNMAFLNGYRSPIGFEVQNDGSAYCISADYPGGWTAIGRNSGSNLRTVFFRQHASGGSGMIYTYNPSKTSETGRNVYDLMYEWFSGTPAQAGKTISEGAIAFAISRYNDDDSSPDLTLEETALRGKLLDAGFNISYIRTSRLAQSDLSGAKFVVAGDHPSIAQHTASALLTGGKNIGLFYTSGAAVGGQWTSSTSASYRTLHVETSADYLVAHSAGFQAEMQSTGSAWNIHSEYPGGWIAIGRNNNANMKTAFSFRGNGRGAILTYNPAHYTAAGDTVFAHTITWLSGVAVHLQSDRSEIPTVFKLHQNHPNPFNPGTTLRYDLPEAAHVQIGVYTVTGQRVGMPVNRNMDAGYHTSYFDASALASGVYLYRITVTTADGRGDMQIKTRKMMLVK